MTPQTSPTTDIVLLGAEGDSTAAIYHALSAEFGRPAVVLEDHMSRWQMLARRAKRLGLAETAGQVAFMATRPVLRWRAGKRLRALRAALATHPIDGTIVRVASVNSEEARQALLRLAPRVVVVSGTRIIAKATLECVACPFINMHAGITPLYRGVHGAYWALAEGRASLVGTTVHLIDAGIDTGAVIEQVTFEATPDDSFETYPLLHVAAGLPALIRAVRAALNGSIQLRSPLTGESKLRYHPTLWTYLSRRLLHGVK